MSALSGGQEIIDVIGVGFGPANLALAIAFEELDIPLSIHFLDKRVGPGWQDGMLLDSSDIQNHPLRDLVTPRNPRSRMLDRTRAIAIIADGMASGADVAARAHRRGCSRSPHRLR